MTFSVAGSCLTVKNANPVRGPGAIRGSPFWPPWHLSIMAFLFFFDESTGTKGPGSKSLAAVVVRLGRKAALESGPPEQTDRGLSGQRRAWRPPREGFREITVCRHDLIGLKPNPADLAGRSVEYLIWRSDQIVDATSRLRSARVATW